MGRRLAAAALLLSLSGCLFTTESLKDGSVVRTRLDRNTYRTPALSITTYDHLPARTAHVRHFRWLHGADPVLPYPGEHATNPRKRRGLVDLSD